MDSKFTAEDLSKAKQSLDALLEKSASEKSKELEKLVFEFSFGQIETASEQERQLLVILKVLIIQLQGRTTWYYSSYHFFPKWSVHNNTPYLESVEGEFGTKKQKFVISFGIPGKQKLSCRCDASIGELIDLFNKILQKDIRDSGNKSENKKSFFIRVLPLGSVCDSNISCLSQKLWEAIWDTHKGYPPSSVCNVRWSLFEDYGAKDRSKAFSKLCITEVTGPGFKIDTLCNLFEITIHNASSEEKDRKDRKSTRLN